MVYTVKEVSKMLLISERAVTKRCFKNKVNKIRNRYAIEIKYIEQWKKDIQKNLLKEPVRGFIGTGTQLNIIDESLKVENEELKQQLKNIKQLKNIELFKLDKIENYDFEFNGTKGNLVFIPKDKVYEDFSPAEYDKMNEVVSDHPYIIKEVKSLRNEKEDLNIKLTENSKQIHSLLETINGSLKAIHQSNFIIAKDRGYDKK